VVLFNILYDTHSYIKLLVTPCGLSNQSRPFPCPLAIVGKKSDSSIPVGVSGCAPSAFLA